MSLKSYLAVFVVIILVSTIVATVLINDNSDLIPSEKFSEFWLLDSNHETDNFPFNVTSGEAYTVFVDVANHMDSTQDYVVYVKFRSYNQYLLDSSSTPSSLSPIYNFALSVDDENVSETAVTFEFRDVSLEDNVITVEQFVINGDVNTVRSSSNWTSTNDGYYFQVLFELWRYDQELGRYDFTDLSLGLWMNMTISGF